MNVNHLTPEDLKDVASRLPESLANGLSRKRVLITGSMGFLGRSIYESLAHLNSVRNLGMKFYLHTSRPREALRFSELIGSQSCTRVIDRNKHWSEPGHFDIVVHAGSPTSPKEFKRLGASAITGPVNEADWLMQAAMGSGHSVFLHLSSVEVYGFPDGEKDLLVDEKHFFGIDPQAARSSYPIQKLAVESLGASYSAEGRLNFIALRLDHVYGPGMSLGDGRVVGDFFKDAVNSDTITIQSDGSKLLRLTYVSDFLYGALVAITTGVVGAYNLCSQDPAISLRDFAQQIVDSNSSRASRISVLSKSFDHRMYLKSSPPSLDSAKLRELGWAPEVSLSEGIDRTLKSILVH